MVNRESFFIRCLRIRHNGPFDRNRKSRQESLGPCRKAKEAVVAGQVEGDEFVATKVEVK